MARYGTPRRWLALLVVLAGVGLAGTTIATAPERHKASHPGSPVSLAANVVEAAIVPARIETGPGGTQQAPGRSFLPLLAGLVTLAGVVGLTVRRWLLPVDSILTLLARRHAIALRAPPRPQLV